MNKSRQRRHCFYYEKLKQEMKFKEAVKALLTPPIKTDKRIRRKP